MNKEIKRILDYLKNEKAYLHYGIRREKFIELEGKEVQTLLDHMTNLQQEIEVLDEVVNYERHIRNDKLQQENKRLKEENEELNKMCELYSKSLYNAELTDYKSRCKKAIELYKNCKEEDYCILSVKMYEILNGSDNK